MEIQFQLGLRLERLEKPREAIPCLEAARNWLPAAEAEVEMGECWQLIKQYGKALDCYRAAQHAAHEHVEVRKRSLYAKRCWPLL